MINDRGSNEGSSNTTQPFHIQERISNQQHNSIFSYSRDKQHGTPPAKQQQL
jgi:hypothetical protein